MIATSAPSPPAVVAEASPLENGATLREVARLFVQSQRSFVACRGRGALTQCLLLSEVGRAGALSLGELARRLGLDKSWVSRSVGACQREGLIAVEPDHGDRRRVCIRLTTAGERRYAELNHDLNDHASAVFAAIPQHEVAHIGAALRTLRAALGRQSAAQSAPRDDP